VATLINPWGWGIYSALVRQSRAMAGHSAWIAEWGSVPLNWTAAASMFYLRSPRGTFYLLLIIAAAAALGVLFQRQIGAAILLIGAVYVGAQQVRMDALAGCVVVVVGGSLLFSAVRGIRAWIPNDRIRTSLATTMVVLLALLALTRSVDVVRNRRNHGMSRFGAGLSWWFPERAAEFIEHENLPREIFNTYDEGGYIAWRLGPNYRDYIDGRALPFDPESFQHQAELMSSSLDSELWQREAERYNIHTIILPLARFQTWGAALRPFCRSADWGPVYLDEISAVFVRRTPETEDLIRRLQVDCSTASLPAGPLLQSADGSFNQWANAAAVLADLDRKFEALKATYNALVIFPDDSFMRWLRGNIFYAMGLSTVAEREYLAALSVDPDSPAVWLSLATVYKDEGRLPETIHAQQRGIELSTTPQPLELVRLAGLYLEVQQPQAALRTFDKAVRSAPPDILATTGEHSFSYHVALGRAAAFRSLGDTKHATYFEEEAIRDLAPQK
jgi:tetratricopeptide (TPR) repeat protein